MATGKPGAAPSRRDMLLQARSNIRANRQRRSLASTRQRIRDTRAKTAEESKFGPRPAGPKPPSAAPGSSRRDILQSSRARIRHGRQAAKHKAHGDQPAPKRFPTDDVRGKTIREGQILADKKPPSMIPRRAIAGSGKAPVRKALVGLSDLLNY